MSKKLSKELRPRPQKSPSLLYAKLAPVFGALGLALGWWVTTHADGLLLPRLYNAIKSALNGVQRSHPSS